MNDSDRMTDAPTEDLSLEAPTVGERARRGSVWAFIEQLYIWSLTFGARIFLARLLTPRDFGLVALVTLVQGLVTLFGKRGIGAALIQRKDDVDDFANASFWLNPVLGAIIGIAQIGAAPLAAAFFHEPLLSPLLMVSAIGFFVSPWGATHATLLTKTLQIKQRAIRHMVLRTVALAAMVIMARLGYGVWSFIIPALLADPIEVWLNWSLCRWRPRFAFRVGLWRDILDYGRHVMGANVLRYFVDNTDYFLLGRILGAGPLGLYSFAFKQSMFAVHNVSLVAGKISFPTFALLQTDRETLMRSFAKILLLIVSFTLPLQLWQLAVAPEYFGVVYGAKWLPAVEAFRVLLIYGIALTVAEAPRQLLAATGRPDLVWKFQALVWPVLVGGLLAGVRFGITGAAVAVGVTLGVSSWLFVFYALRKLRWPVRPVLGPLWAPLASSAAMYVAVVLVRAGFLAAGARPAIVFVLCLPLGLLVYALTLAWWFPKTWHELIGFITRSLRDFGRDASGMLRRLRQRFSFGTAA